MKKLITILFFIQCACSLFSQNRQVADSVLRLLDVEKREDTTLVRRYIRLASVYTTFKPDSSIYYADVALKLSEKLNYDWGKAWAYRTYSSAFKVMGDFPFAIEFLQRADNLVAKSKKINPLWDTKSVWANMYFAQGEYRQTIDFYLQELSKQKKTSESQLSTLYLFTAASYAGLKMPDSALFFARLSFPIVLKRNSQIGWAHFIFGEAYFQLNKLDSAMFNYKLSYLMSPARGGTFDFINSAIGIANVYKARGNIDSCIWYAKLALAESQANTFRDRAIIASNILGEVYEKTNPTESIRYYKLAFAINDSVFGQQKIRQVQNLKYAGELRKRDVEEKDKESKAKLRVYLLIGGLITLLLSTLLLIRNNQHKQKAKAKIEKAYGELKATQSQLIQSEKMASLGELTAGIAHEIQNPLNFVNNFSEVNKELLAEMNEEIEKGNFEEVKTIAKDVTENEDKIIFHGKRADSIVKGMLQHSRSSSGVKEPTDINALADEYLRLAYHGLRAKDKSFNATMKTDFDESIGKVNIIPQDIGRVILNLITNAFYAAPLPPPENIGINSGGGSDPDYVHNPTVWVSTKRINTPSGDGGKVEIRVRDNGPGIPQKILDKIFQPFFTTKPTGHGTGLGLSMSYDIVTKGHGGELKVKTKEGEGAEFIIILPVV